jgi:hypothetical protein
MCSTAMSARSGTSPTSRRRSSAEHEIIEQLYRDNYGTEYDILVDYPYADWQTGYQRFLDVTNGFSAP